MAARRPGHNHIIAKRAADADWRKPR